ncbi:MAG: DUF4214 domain-containing protein [Rhodoferax sp.]|nr:DUF4214 domain-containing protein [Rhodoferax sp.]
MKNLFIIFLSILVAAGAAMADDTNLGKTCTTCHGDNTAKHLPPANFGGNQSMHLLSDESPSAATPETPAKKQALAKQVIRTIKGDFSWSSMLKIKVTVQLFDDKTWSSVEDYSYISIGENSSFTDSGTYITTKLSDGSDIYVSNAVGSNAPGDVDTAKFIASFKNNSSTAYMGMWRYSVAQGSTSASLMVVFDSQDCLVETNSQAAIMNTCSFVISSATPSTTGPDLVVTNVSVGSSVTVGGNLSITFDVKNQGTANAGANWAGIYLSLDTTLNKSDISIEKGCTIKALAPGETDGCQGDVAILATTPPGTYYVGVYVDKDSAVTESNESNNGLAATNTTTISSGACSSTSKSAVYKSYIGYYARCPDQQGLTYWCGQLDAAGGNLGSIIAGFGTSAEYTARFSGLTDTQLITNLYNNLFNRGTDSTGLQFYQNLLTQRRGEFSSSHGGSSNGATEYALSRIALDVLNGASGGDLTTLTGKISACPAY